VNVLPDIKNDKEQQRAMSVHLDEVRTSGDLKKLLNQNDTTGKDGAPIVISGDVPIGHNVGVLNNSTQVSYRA
jgi:hypothetical protein